MISKSFYTNPKLFTLFLCLFGLIHGVSSQSTYQKVLIDYGKSVQSTTDGGLVIAGTKIGELGRNDMSLIKMDKDGNMIWSKAYGNADFKGGKFAHETSDGGYIACGFSEGGTVSAYRIDVVKTDFLGNIIWSKKYGGPPFSSYIAYQIKETQDNGFVMCGHKGPPSIGQQAFMLKTNEIGDTLWTKEFNYNFGSKAYALEETLQGDYLIVGQVYNSIVNIVSNVLFIKTNSVGDTIWTKSFGGLGNDVAYSVKETEDGYILAGNTYSFGNGQSDVFLIKTNFDGLPMWSITYGGVKWENCYDLELTMDGGYVLIGGSDSFGDNNNCYLIKTNQNGSLEWANIYGLSGYDQGYCVTNADNGGFSILGGIGSNSFGELYLLKTDENGFIGCNERFTNTIEESFEVQLFNPEVSIKSGCMVTEPEIEVIDYDVLDSTLCFTVNTPEYEKPIKKVSVSPNPINNGDLLSIKGNGIVEYSILSTIGEIVQYGKLYRNELNTLRIGNVKTGVYIVQLKTDNQIFTEKIFVR